MQDGAGAEPTRSLANQKWGLTSPRTVVLVAAALWPALASFNCVLSASLFARSCASSPSLPASSCLTPEYKAWMLASVAALVSSVCFSLAWCACGGEAGGAAVGSSHQSGAPLPLHPSPFFPPAESPPPHPHPHRTWSSAFCLLSDSIVCPSQSTASFSATIVSSLCCSRVEKPGPLGDRGSALAAELFVGEVYLT